MFKFLKKEKSNEYSKVEPELIFSNLEAVPKKYIDSEPKLSFDNHPYPSDHNIEISNNLDLYIGKLIIEIKNEIINPIVGVGLEIKENELIIFDVVSRKKNTVNGFILLYTIQKFEAINNIEPNSRIALFLNANTITQIQQKPKQGIDFSSPAIWKEKVYDGIEKINRGEW